jgi:chemotaxis protein MotB
MGTVSAGSGDRFGEDYVDFETSVGDSGWMVTYADMMTIIVSFLILLLSISTITQTKFDMLVESLTGRKVGNLHKVKEKIDQVVDRAALGGEVTTSIDEDGLKVQFSNALLFDSGEAVLREKALEVFEPISDHMVNELEPQYGVTIEGYTDDVPIENGKFQSNWELSTSRAINVMERLADEGFDRRRMSVQGFADTRSATDVDLHDEAEVDKLSDERLAEVRAKNRRVVLRINTLDREVLRELFDGEIPGKESKKGGASTTGGGGGFGGFGGGQPGESTSSNDGADASEGGLKFPGTEDGGSNASD